MDNVLLIQLLTTDEAAWIGPQDRGAAHGSLHDALEAAGHRDVIMAVPGEHVSMMRVALPPVRRADQRQRAAAYALEDRLARSVEALHFALGPADDRDGRPVAVVDREDMDAWLGAVPAEGAYVAAVVPDYLCLPEPAPRTASLAVDGDRMLVRLDRYNGFACEPDMLGPMLDGLGDERPARIIAFLPRDGGDDLPVDPGVDVERRTYTELPALLGDGLSTPPPINLRQHDYAPQARQAEWWQPLRWTAALAAVWILLLVGVRGVEAWQLQQRVDTYRETAVTRFREAFPDVGTINDIRVQAEQGLRSLQGQGSPLFELLQATAAATAEDQGLRLQSLQYRGGQLHLNLRGESIQALEALRAGFADQPGARLEVESADAAAEGVQIRARVIPGQA